MLETNLSTEKLINQCHQRLDQITLKIEDSKSNPEVVSSLRNRYKEVKKELYRLYLLLDEEQANLN